MSEVTAAAVIQFFFENDDRAVWHHVRTAMHL
jgi:hypothetical protein